MKFTVTMKDPDTLHDSIREVVAEEVNAMANLDAEEKEGVIDNRVENTLALCKTWFEYSEYVSIEIDTDAKTATVLPAK